MVDLILWNEVDRFCDLLGRPTDDVFARLFPPKKGPGKDKGAQNFKLDRGGRQSVERTLAMPLYRFHSLGIIPNPGGQKAEQITGGAALFAEADGGLPLEAQVALPQRLGLPEPTFTVWTGNKSLHLYWCAKEGMALPPVEWKKAQAWLIAAIKKVAPEAGVDEAIKDLSRVMRAPGGLHPATGERARIHSESGERYDLTALVERLPARKPQGGVTINRGLPRPEAPAKTLPKDQWKDLVIVRRLWAQSQLPFDRRMLKLIAEDAPAMAEELGYGSPEEFIRSELDLDPDLHMVAPQTVEGATEVALEDDVAKALDALAFLPPKEFTCYDKWIDVGMTLHSVSESLLDDWIEWSRGMGDAFDEAEHHDKWRTFDSEKEEGLTLGTLIHLAKDYGFRPRATADTSSRLTAGVSGVSGVSGVETKSVRSVRKLSTQERLDLLRETAELLLEQGTTPLDRLPVLREKASELDLSIRDGELNKLVWEARRKNAPAAEALGTGDVLDFTPVPWCWEGLLMRQATNLVVALPKDGKTSLILAAIATWSRGESFLGREFHGPCPAVLIVGSDQPQSDWGRMLQRVGLVDEERRLTAPIVGLFHSGAPLSLDPEGIERITNYAKEHPGLVVMIDSYARCVASLGVSERDAEIAGPLADLQEALGPYGATIVVIHHSNKGSRNESASLASRGSTALPAACSQILHLQRLEAPEGGQQNSLSGKRMLTTEGRGGAPEKFLLELDSEGKWLCKGDGDALLQEQERQKTIGALNDRLAIALEHVEETWEQTGLGMSADLLASLMELHGSDPSRVARRFLEQLRKLRLVKKTTINLGMGKGGLTTRYVPATADTADTADTPAHKREEVSGRSKSVSVDVVDPEDVPLETFPVGLFESVEALQGGLWSNGWVVSEEGSEMVEVFRSEDPGTVLRLPCHLVRPCRS